ncbi:autotransporter outer membrane beta-barrel domain-containing protein [Paraburkholderia kururiensis]|uniref:Autotransporter outer membrane beta-barrel domain-containing protein n=1 Tax=Paraburkholderia kururiensis TaxID=984307 RepID=A0ABZ0WLC6_9BURK|nr:autotransporter outer membrane beta-barrel domain-containing protein [Paraburkholderia kururiensis]WQD78154.1 autotransporter outer membrane beta-barrel domain-containing protein [Paraburkholderia kururiensis]
MGQPHTANILHDFLSPGRVTVGGTPFDSALGKTWYELGVGVTASYGKAGEMYASAKYQHSLGGEHRKGVYGQVGYRYSW